MPYRADYLPERLPLHFFGGEIHFPALFFGKGSGVAAGDHGILRGVNSIVLIGKYGDSADSELRCFIVGFYVKHQRCVAGFFGFQREFENSGTCRRFQGLLHHIGTDDQISGNATLLQRFKVFQVGEVSQNFTFVPYGKRISFCKNLEIIVVGR